MRVVDLKKIEREDFGLYYRRQFSAEAEVETPLSVLELPIKFIIETDPLGAKSVSIEFSKEPDYPLIPLKSALTQTIFQMDKEGRLPV